MGELQNLIAWELQNGRQYENLFCEVSGASRGNSYDDIQHIDCWLEGKSVDVKGLKNSSQSGYVLLEFMNVKGNAGWCSPKGADLISFMYKEGFYVFKNEDLWSTWASITYTISNGKVIRKNRLNPSDYLYRLLGRESRKDVFCYITKDNLLQTQHAFYELK